MKKENLCSRCLKRYEALSGKLLGAEFQPAEDEKECVACRGVFLKTRDFLQKALESAKGFEFQTFLVGCILPDKVMDKEKELKERLGIEGVNGVKQEINRETGIEIEKTGKKFDLKEPDAQIVLDYIGSRVKLQLKPLYVYGRYLKLERGLPQTKWPCRWCSGQGCKKCEFKGKMYAESVEELIAGPFMKAAQGKRHSFHGKGREDIDARMLGNGRPFVLEVEEPVKRYLDFAALEGEVNKENAGRVQVIGLRPSDKKEVVRIKAEASDKEYEAVIECDAELTSEDAARVEALSNLELSQVTPERVAHRRADLTRKRKVLKARVASLEGNSMKLALRTESGTYVKEFISGDNGRTNPSISSILGKKCVCTALDVVRVEGD
ncbi:MAG TPA: tRNA pseudouridine(54/55) synthase Pus10 [archaeon]|nr:tRNA pseudouridine(54/55) synthase Pus10 [archaeon]